MSEPLKQTIAQERLLQVIRQPHMSEKGTIIGEKHRHFIFKVATDANKLEIKQAVEFIFNVKVLNVRVVNVRGKVSQFKQQLGKRKGWKKAYVALEEGNDIDFMGTK